MAQKCEINRIKYDFRQVSIVEMNVLCMGAQSLLS
jgi:hypothetical protein